MEEAASVLSKEERVFRMLPLRQTRLKFRTHSGGSNERNYVYALSNSGKLTRQQLALGSTPPAHQRSLSL